MTHNAFNADCMEIMSRYPDKWFDLAVVDPPYGIGMNGGVSYGRPSRPNQYKSINLPKHEKKAWDNKRPDAEYWNNIFKVSKNQIIFGANYFVNYLAPSMGWIYWGKFEDDSNFSDGELIYTSFERALKSYYSHPFKGTNGGKTRIHPTQKPVALYDWIFKNYLPNGGRVLDTHGGSMSSLISAIKAGNIEMTISELDADYYASAQKRVNEFISQLNLFQERPNIIW
jgi:site-specific DNA-methyltransferase (adenine-specific)